MWSPFGPRDVDTNYEEADPGEPDTGEGDFLYEEHLGWSFDPLEERVRDLREDIGAIRGTLSDLQDRLDDLLVDRIKRR